METKKITEDMQNYNDEIRKQLVDAIEQQTGISANM